MRPQGEQTRSRSSGFSHVRRAMCISGGVVLALTALVVLAEVMTDDGAAEPPGSPAALRPTPLEVVFGVAAPLFYFSVLTVLIAVVMTVRARAAEKSTLF